jgi:hypothetical protein
MFDSFRVKRRVSDLEEEVSKLKRKFAELELDWNNTYDKMRSMMGRIAKRADVVDNAARTERPESEGVDREGLTTSPLWSKLTARQKQIQMQVLNRRANGGT